MKYLVLLGLGLFAGLLQVQLIFSLDSLSLMDRLAQVSLIFPALMVVIAAVFAWQVAAHKFTPTTTLSAVTLRHLFAIGLVLAMISPVAGFNSAFVLEQEFKRMFSFQEVTVKSQPRGYYIKL